MLKTISNFNKLIQRHPLTASHKLQAFIRFFRWQLAAFIMKAPMVVPWVNGSRLMISKGMVGATGNFYFGLHEFEDMGFLLHFLRAEDLFVDAGANVGSYTVLAGAVCGARVIAVEPILFTVSRLKDNINVNAIAERVNVLNIGLGAAKGELRFSNDLDAENHVIPLSSDAANGAVIPVESLNEVLAESSPTLIKIDVEGFEAEVLKGADQVLKNQALQAILIELNGAGSRYGFSEDRIRETIEDLGFQLCAYDPFTRELSTIERQQANSLGNSLYVRDLKWVQSRLNSADEFRIYDWCL